ncbi:DUF4314 domain-containing protein [Aureimonas sp. AU40]|uniref:DUF4314 domain-containing protein n=1 Tax=Aureimonas sp. AU40 TaxID=1637747 RepID=UPI000784D630|nr:DUF4314 domain-containing protein [Aureimonas sp. AU40]
MQDTERPLKEGQRIRMVRMEDDPHPIEAGTEGTVTSYAHFYAGRWTIGVKWDDGRSLSIVHGFDQVVLLSGNPES